MSYRQHKTGFKKSLWEQEEFNNFYSKEECKYNKQARYSRSGHSMNHQGQHTNYVGPPRWTDKVSEFYSYNRAIAVDGGYRRNQIPGKYFLDKGCKTGGNGYNSCGKMEKKEGRVIFSGAKNGGNERTVNLHGQKRRVMGILASHGYSSCSDSDRYSESDSDSD